MWTMSGATTVGVAALAVDAAGSRFSELQSSASVRGASVIKPLLFWVGAASPPFATDPAGWERIARPAVTTSDNDATAALWSRAGGRVLLASLRERTGVAWATAGSGEHPALRVMVTARELAQAYAVFASDVSACAKQLRRWMCEVPAAQTFGLRPVAGDALGAPEASVGVKCGWFGLERAHAVVLVEQEGRFLGAAVTACRSPDAASDAALHEALRDPGEHHSKLPRAHDLFLGQAVRSATREALLAATAL